MILPIKLKENASLLQLKTKIIAIQSIEPAISSKNGGSIEINSNNSICVSQYSNMSKLLTIGKSNDNDYKLDEKSTELSIENCSQAMFQVTQACKKVKWGVCCVFVFCFVSFILLCFAIFIFCLFFCFVLSFVRKSEALQSIV